MTVPTDEQMTMEPVSQIPRRRPLLVVAVVLLAGLAVWQAAGITRVTALIELEETGQERLTLYESTLKAALNNYRYLPFVVTRDEGVIDLIMGRGSVAETNLYLESVNDQAGADALYILDHSGETLAASNWRRETSFVGHNYGFRPYFRDAIAGRPGGFFAIGATTGEPGYFMSWPIGDGTAGSQPRGVAVVKVNLDPLQQHWRDGGETVFVSDASGVIFLSSRQDWKYRTLDRLTPAVLDSIRSGRQYRGIDLQPLNITPVDPSDPDVRGLEGVDYMLQSRRLAELGWTLHYLSPLNRVTARVTVAVIIAATLVVLLIIAALLLRERRRQAVSAQRAREATAIRQVNTRLQAEIDERRRTERELRDTQNELVQAGKLAALGQMSAAIAHELNQPLAAIQTFLAGSRVFLKKGETAQVEENLTMVSGLTDRMAAITGQLKTFARKSEGKLEPVVLQDIIDDALNLLEPRIRLEEVEISLSLPGEPVTVQGDSVRLGQVLMNFIGNAIDAMRDSATRRLSITLKEHAGTAELVMDDTGHGISEEIRSRLFDPFFTTKEVGDGVGLGLSISYGIVTDLGGSLQAGNNESGGARFSIRLPACRSPHLGKTGTEP